jgi:alkylation response protein AidB-like acyl-CoA dehydrogenase
MLCMTSLDHLQRDHEGLEMGKRHDPLAGGFMHGTIYGEDVFIPIESVLGGQQRCGQGWGMVMEALEEGRSVSLPASAVGGAQLALNSVGAYSRIRKQFRQPIAEMGGVQEALSRIGAETFIVSAAQQLMNASIAADEQSSTICALVKYETTSRSREVINGEIDVLPIISVCTEM